MWFVWVQQCLSSMLSFRGCSSAPSVLLPEDDLINHGRIAYMKYEKRLAMPSLRSRIWGYPTSKCQTSSKPASFMICHHFLHCHAPWLPALLPWHFSSSSLREKKEWCLWLLLSYLPTRKGQAEGTQLHCWPWTTWKIAPSYFSYSGMSSVSLEGNSLSKARVLGTFALSKQF